MVNESFTFLEKVQKSPSKADNSIHENATEAPDSENKPSEDANETPSELNENEEEETPQARQKRLMAKFWKPRRSLAHRLKGITLQILIIFCTIKYQNKCVVNNI